MESRFLFFDEQHSKVDVEIKRAGDDKFTPTSIDCNNVVDSELGGLLTLNGIPFTWGTVATGNPTAISARDDLIKGLKKIQTQQLAKNGVTVSTTDGNKWDADRTSSKKMYDLLHLYSSIGTYPTTFKLRNFFNEMVPASLELLKEICILCWEHDERIKQRYWEELDTIRALPDSELVKYKLPITL